MPIATTTRAGWAQVTYTDSHTRACRRVGSQEVAEQIAGWSGDRYALPEGWEFLGAGATRAVALGPDGWAYKVSYAGYGRVNDIEIKYWARGKAHPEYRNHIPHHRIFEVGRRKVVAMERLTVDRSRSSADADGQVMSIKRMAHHIGCEDIHMANIGWRGNVAVLMDAGCGTIEHLSKYDGCVTCNPNFKES